MTRREAREQGFLLAFESDFLRDDDFNLESIIENAQIARDVHFDKYAIDLADGIFNSKTELDDIISKHSTNWNIKRISKITLTILRLAIYEIKYSEGVPESVAINEAVEIAKKYAGPEDATFINGVLGGISKGLSK